MKRLLGSCAVAAVCALAPAAAHAAPCVIDVNNDLLLDAQSCELSGEYVLDELRLINNSRITVNPYTSGSTRLTGNLQVRGRVILVDATSRITARGAGYVTPLCGDGVQPGGSPAAGGCSVSDSGGGGSHFGAGGRGTKDCNATTGCTFPLHWEEDCGNTNTGTACVPRTDCRNGDSFPTTASTPYFHNIYAADFGGSGGDKGCRDNDGYGLKTAGNGGGRIVLAGVADGGGGTLTVNGTLDADGKRGCGYQNDSAGGGAGGTILLAGDTVTIGAAARISAAGGLGGDTRGSLDPTGDCVGAQQGSTCDDCGGGGGGGIISVLSVAASVVDTAVFNVGGAAGGTCAICQGEAGGGPGELQLSGAYLGEFCDGFDNDFDGVSDEDLPALVCPGGATPPSCLGGVPQSCPADFPACVGPVTDTRARFVVIVDSSGSMLNDLDGTPTLGDGSVGHVGFDMDGDGTAGDDSRLFLAKRALSQVIAAYPDIDFALARYHQDQDPNQSCQLAHWFECADICCSYDDPRNNEVPAPVPACAVDGGSLGPVTVNMNSPGDECINYAGNCGPPRRGADVLVGFGADINQYLMWLDGRETLFVDTEVTGDYCAGGDCELRGTGPTPLDNALRAAHDFLSPQITCDAAEAGGCRTYGVILLTDGAESCNGTPTAAATALRTQLGVQTYVVGFSVLSSEETELNAIANAGSTSGTRPAFLVGSENELANALASIVADSVVFETCNDDDDDCDTRVDEDFPTLGAACDDGELGDCRGTGTLVCNLVGDGVRCLITDEGEAPGVEVCNGEDDNCNGLIDEDLNCQTPCTPTGPDLCDGVDNDCNGAVDDADPMVGDDCGASEEGICELGVFACIAGDLVCIGAVYPDPGGETCDGDDDDCNGVVDEQAPCPTDTACVDGGCRLPCGSGEFACPLGFDCVNVRAGRFCVPGPCATCTAGQVCQDDACVDPCADVVCGPGEQCRLGDCLDCASLGCPSGEVCLASQCVDDPCAAVDCDGAAGCDGELGCSCVGGGCVPNCDDTLCPAGQRCGGGGACVDDPCAAVTCPGNDVCVDGACLDNPCNGIPCPPGDVCSAGACVDDPCPATECSPGRRCVVDDDGAAVCEAITPRLPPDRVYAGGGGCRSGGDGAAGSLGGLALLALALGLGRRRAR